MEVIAFALGLDPILTRTEVLAEKYRTWKGNKEQIPELRESFQNLEKDLSKCVTLLQTKTANLPQESRAIVDSDITALTNYLSSARTALHSVNRRMNRSGILQFFRTRAVAQDCDTVRTNVGEARKLLQNLNKYVDVLSNVRKVEVGQREMKENLESVLVGSSSNSGVRGNEVKLGDSSFHPYFDTPYDKSKLVFDFNSKDEDGNASMQEGRLLEVLLDKSPDMNREVAVRGIGGVGKTSLMRGIRGLDVVKERFEDGVYNISVGMDATCGELIESLSTVVQNSGGDETSERMRGENKIKKVMKMFRSWFAEKRCLFVIDDVWETKEIPLSTIHELIKLHVCGRDSKVVLTTRNRKIASEAERYFELEARGILEKESREIILKYSGIDVDEGEEEDKKVMNKILEECGGLPLFLAVSGKMVRTLSFRHGHEGCMAYHVYARELESSMQSLFSTDIGDYERLSSRLMISVKLLEERKEDLEFGVKCSMGELHRRLSVMKKQTRVPMTMLKQLWEVEDENEAATIAREFEQVGLGEVEFERRGCETVEMLRLHDSMYEFCVRETQKHGEEMLWHETLIRRYGECLTKGGMHGEWWGSCIRGDGYIHENVCRHLLRAGRGRELVELLLKPQWAERQLNVNGIPFLKNDFCVGMKAVQDLKVDYSEEECCEMEEVLELISDTITLLSPFISKNDSELWFQLHGRLKRYGDRLRRIGEYVGWIETKARKPLALCLNDFLGGPGGANTKIVSIGFAVCCMAMLDDGDRIACGCCRGYIVVMNIYESEVEKKWKAHNKDVWAISVGRNGTRLVSGSKDGEARVWDVSTELCLASFEGHFSAIRGVEVLKDGKRVVSVSEDGSAQVWEMDTGRLVLPPFTRHEASVRCVATLGESDHVITGGVDSTLRLWSTRTGSQIGDPFEGHEGSINSIAVTLDERYIVSGSVDGTVRMWNIETRKKMLTSFMNDIVCCVSVSRDGSRIVSGSYPNGTIQVRDSESGAQVCDPMEEHGIFVTGVSFLASNDSIVSCSMDETVRVWDVRRKKTARNADRHSEIVSGISFTPNGKFVVSGSFDGTLQIWDPSSGKRIGDSLNGHSGYVNNIAMTPDGRCVVSVSNDKTVGVWDFESRGLLHRFKGHTDKVWCVAVTPKGDVAVTGSEDKTVRIWDLLAMDGSHVVLEGHNENVIRVFITDDGLRAVSVDLEEVFVWDLKTHEIFKRLKFEDAWTLSREGILVSSMIFKGISGEDTGHDNIGLSIPLNGREIFYGQSPDRIVLASLESSVMSWDLSPDMKTICLGMSDGNVGFLRLIR